MLDLFKECSWAMGNRKATEIPVVDSTSWYKPLLSNVAFSTEISTTKWAYSAKYNLQCNIIRRIFVFFLYWHYFKYKVYSFCFHSSVLVLYFLSNRILSLLTYWFKWAVKWQTEGVCDHLIFITPVCENLHMHTVLVSRKMPVLIRAKKQSGCNICWWY